MTIESNSNVPSFNVSAADLLGAIDSITDCAAQAIEKAQQAISTLPPEAHQIVTELLNHLRIIGHAADATVADCNADLAEVWGVAA